MALFPLEPALSRMILASIHHDCADDMVTLPKVDLLLEVALGSYHASPGALGA